jgi:hypothetical protein
MALRAFLDDIDLPQPACHSRGSPQRLGELLLLSSGESLPSVTMSPWRVTRRQDSPLSARFGTAVASRHRPPPTTAACCRYVTGRPFGRARCHLAALLAHRLRETAAHTDLADDRHACERATRATADIQQLLGRDTDETATR